MNASSPSLPLGLYIHTPFCVQRCVYCDFFTMPLEGAREQQFGPFLTALLHELRVQASRFSGRTLRSIFFGGGTPSLLLPAEIEQILSLTAACFAWEDDIEITLEINPETITLSNAKAFRKTGVNRASIGIQSLDPQQLRLLGRLHSAEKARACFDLLRDAGFDNISLDFIYGRPGQTLSDWERELERLLSWGADHLSMYELILEPGTPMTRAVNRGELVLPSEEERLAMYRAAREATEAAGMLWYETSNYARPTREARHNLDNWRGGEYLGVGPGAHSFCASPTPGARRANPRNMPMYLEDPNGAPWKPRTHEEACFESLLNGLRLREGFPPSRLQQHLQVDAHAMFGDRLPALRDAQYLDALPDLWTLTPRGAELLDSILVYLFNSNAQNSPKQTNTP